MHRRIRTACALVIGIQVVRALLVPLISSSPDLGPDGPTYLQMARDTVHQGWPFPAIGVYYWGALNTLVMSLLVRIADSVAFLRGINAIELAAVLALTWRLTRRVFGRTAAWIATASLAAQEVLLYVKFLQYELLMALLLLEALTLVDAGVRRRALLPAAAGGLCLGLAGLTQLKVVAVWAVLAPWLIAWGARAYRRPRGDVLRLVAGASCALALPLAFWALRNQALTGRATLQTTGGGVHFFLSNNEFATGRWGYPPGFRQYAEPGLDGWQLDAHFFARGWAWIREHPGRFVALVPRKLHATLEVDRPLNLIVVLLALAGAWSLGRRLITRRPALILAPILVTLAVHVVFLGGGRYRWPALPSLHALAAWGLLAVLSARRR